MNKRLMISVSFISLLAHSAYAYCPPQYQETWVEPMFTESTLVMNSALATVDAQLTALMKFNDQRVLSALAVLTKQKALSGNIVADTERKSTQQVANGLKVLSSFKQISEARLNYGPEFGQGYNPCKISNERNGLSNQNAEVGKRVNELVRSAYSAPGRYVSDLSATKHQLLKDIAIYCTQDYVESGLCSTVGKYPGLALNASVMFTTDAAGNEYNNARSTFINTIMGEPDLAVSKDQAKTPQAQQYALLKQEKDALVSPALTAFANLQSNYSSIDHAGESVNKSVMAQYNNQVKRYFGDSEENINWNKVLTAQTERGLLVEQLKMKALTLSLQAKQYKEYELMEGQIAALLAQELRKNKSLEARYAAAQAKTSSISNTIK